MAAAHVNGTASATHITVENCELAGWPDLSLSPSAILQELDSTSLVSSPKKHTARPKSPGPGVALNEFEVLDVDAGRSLGKGSFGVVRRIRRKGTQDVYALKTMQKIEVIEGDLIDQVEREIQVQRQLKHENVLRLYKHFEDADTVYLLLEYCAKGELYQLLRTRRGRRFTEAVAQHYFVQVTRGLQYLHGRKIVHRDMKPENLLVDHEDVLKIADFGWCADSSVRRTTFCGTPDYLAPEMLEGPGHDHRLDIWSLGVLLYEMVVGRPPFQSTNHALLISKIIAAELRYPPFVPHGVRDLVGRLLQKDPEERLPLDRVLRHSWVVAGSANSTVAITACKPLRETPKCASTTCMEAPLAQRRPQATPTASRANSASCEETPASSRILIPQASPRDVCRGLGKSISGYPHQLQVQNAPAATVLPMAASTCGLNGRTTATASLSSSAAQPLAVRAQAPSSPPSANAYRAPAGQHCSARLASQLKPSQVPRPNKSAPQTPVQQAPFRAVRTAAVVAGTAPGRGGGGVTTALSTSSTAESGNLSRRDRLGTGLAQARRPRSSGTPQSSLTIAPGARNADLAATSLGPSQQGLGSITGSTALAASAAPLTPALQMRSAQQRVPPVAGYPVPSSPKPCPANRSLSPMGMPQQHAISAVSSAVSSTVAGYGGPRPPGTMSRAVPGIALVRRPRSVP
mmetsp:Transcript_100491/g.199573  ORF Transcript_100491/g.199573 Transcript_100491/m.199573 type:complete len:688 (-) Transcript_100491:346-2409(-)